MERTNLFRLVSIVLGVFATGLFLATVILSPTEEESWATPNDVLAAVTVLILLAVFFARYHYSFNTVIGDAKLLLGASLPIGTFLFFINLQTGNIPTGIMRWTILVLFILGILGEVLLLQPKKSNNNPKKGGRQQGDQASQTQQ